MRCFKCDDTLTDAVKCSHCAGNYHFGCVGVSESTYRRMSADKKSKWRCQDCAALPVPDPSSVSSILKELKTFRLDFDEIKKALSDNTQLVSNINMRFKDIDDRFEAIEDRVTLTEKQVGGIPELQLELNSAHDKIKSMEEIEGARNQYSRANNIEISGIPVQKSENLTTILHNICVKIGVNLLETDMKITPADMKTKTNPLSLEEVHKSIVRHVDVTF